MWRRDGDGGDGEVDFKRGGAGQEEQEGGAEQSEFFERENPRRFSRG
jgi:hypothetical protein